MKPIIRSSNAGLGEALKLLHSGQAVAAPTETVYGLAADATNGAAVAAIYLAKGRPSFNPLIVHVDSIAMAKKIGVFDETAVALAEHFWPGALTLVLPLQDNSSVHPLVLAGLDTVALRMPVGILRDLISEFGKPLAAPSANRSGHLSPTTAQAVADSLAGRIELVLDGGPTLIGVESTIVSNINGALTLLRPGGIAAEAIEEFIGKPLNRNESSEILAPGMMASHYAPNARVRLNATQVEPSEAFLGFGGAKASGHPVSSLNLSKQADLAEAAQNLFGFLRALDSKRPTCIAVAPIPMTGLGEAINDRLLRAAAPRDQSYGA